MTDLPRDIAAYRAELERSVLACNVEIAELLAHVARLERDRDMAVSELRGIDAVVAAYRDAANGEALPAQRAPRRDIKAMAAAEIAQTPGWAGMSQDERVRYLCKQLRCKASQVEAALRAVKTGNSGDALGQLTQKEEQITTKAEQDARYLYPSVQQTS